MARVLSGLGDYLDRASQTPFAWGKMDCLLFPAGWVSEATGSDPAADWRGRYHTAFSAAWMIQREGGLLDIVSKGMAGFARTDAPRCGDVGIVEADTATGEIERVGAIRVGSRWAVIWAGGLWFGQPETVAAWRVEGI